MSRYDVSTVDASGITVTDNRTKVSYLLTTEAYETFLEHMDASPQRAAHFLTKCPPVLPRVIVVLLTAGDLAGCVIGCYTEQGDALTAMDEATKNFGRDAQPTMVSSFVFPEGNTSNNNRESTRIAEHNTAALGRRYGLSRR